MKLLISDIQKRAANSLSNCGNAIARLPEVISESSVVTILTESGRTVTGYTRDLSSAWEAATVPAINSMARTVKQGHTVTSEYCKETISACGAYVSPLGSSIVQTFNGSATKISQFVQGTANSFEAAMSPVLKSVGETIGNGAVKAKRYAKESGSYCEVAVIPVMDSITEYTKHIKFIPNGISRAMDTANGGVLSHGGFHRVWGGHSIIDLEMWHKFGFSYPVEVVKDLLTANGVPLPGVQTLVANGVIGPKIATQWLSVNIGDVAGIAVGGYLTARRCYQVYVDPTAHDGQAMSLGFSGGVKLIVGIGTTNVFLVGFGVVDLMLASRAATRNGIATGKGGLVLV